MLKRLGLIITLLSVAPLQATTETTNKGLIQACQSNRTEDKNFCYGFMMGVAGGAQYYRNLVDANDTYMDICFPETLTNQQITEVYLAWIKDNPALINDSAFVGVTTALSIKFSCPTTDPKPSEDDPQGVTSRPAT